MVNSEGILAIATQAAALRWTEQVWGGQWVWMGQCAMCCAWMHVGPGMQDLLTDGWCADRWIGEGH